MGKSATLAGIVLLPGVASAHPDHVSGGDFGLLHFLTDPFHMGLAFAAVAGCLVARRAMLRLHPRRSGR